MKHICLLVWHDHQHQCWSPSSEWAYPTVWVGANPPQSSVSVCALVPNWTHPAPSCS